MERIKKILPRLSNGNFPDNPYPIGADGINIDMMSECNLEEELHLGSPSYTTFNKDAQNNTIIREEYKKSEEQTNNYYVMITTIKKENEITNIIQQLYFLKDENEEPTLKKTKKTTINDLLIKEVVE